MPVAIREAIRTVLVAAAIAAIWGALKAGDRAKAYFSDTFDLAGARPHILTLIAFGVLAGFVAGVAFLWPRPWTRYRFVRTIPGIILPAVLLAASPFMFEQWLPSWLSPQWLGQVSAWLALSLLIGLSLASGIEGEGPS